MSNILTSFILGWAVAAVIFLSIYAIAMVIMAIVAVKESNRSILTRQRARMSEARDSLTTPSVTIIVPAHNEAPVIVKSISSLLDVDYPLLDFVVCDDGSNDETWDRLNEEFDLASVSQLPTLPISTEEIQDVSVSRKHPNLLVIRKNNGGRADAVNCALGYARGEIVVTIDADSVLESLSIRRIVKPFMEDPLNVTAAAGTVLVANGSDMHRDRSDARVSMRPIEGIQEMEYIRGFLVGRVVWSRLNALPIVAGAFGAFKRDDLIKAGGLDTSFIGEDMEITIRLQKFEGFTGEKKKVVYVPEAVCWTEAPAKTSELRGQRMRWHKGLLQVLKKNRDMIGRKEHGNLGKIVMPYLTFIEVIGPVLEIGGYVALVIAAILGIVNPQTALLIAYCAILLGASSSMLGVLVEELAFNRYPRRRDIFKLLLWSIAENFGYRQLTAWWRVRATARFLLGRSTPWGVIERGLTVAVLHDEKEVTNKDANG